MTPISSDSYTTLLEATSALYTGSQAKGHEGKTKLSPIDVLQACLRRWYIVLPIVAISAWNAYGFYASVKPVYYANAVVGVTSSNEGMQFNPDGRPTARNGLLDIGGADLIMNLVVLGFDDPEVRSRVVADGGKGNFTVRMFPAPASAVGQTLPLIMIEASEPDPASATKTVELAASQTDSILTQIQRQAGVPDSQLVRPIKASSPKAVSGMPKRNKKLSLILIFGTALATLAALGVDFAIGRLKQWRRKRPTPNMTTADTRETHHDSRSSRGVFEAVDSTSYDPVHRPAMERRGLERDAPHRAAQK